MLNKSILAAALLTVGAIAGGSAVSAAEIGVRNTTGFSTRTVTGGQSSYVRRVTGQFTENSSGSVLEINANNYSVLDVAESTGAVSTGTFEGGFRGSSRGLVQGNRSIFGVSNGIAVADLNLGGGISGGITLNEGDSSSSTGTVTDGDFRRASSTYTRNESGTIREVARESYNFGGSSRSDFSELSTFSR